MSRRKRKGEAQKRVSEKIRLLRHEGKTAEQAAGEAYGMERSGRLRRGGRYVRKQRRHSSRY